jgi:fatty-acyl-CoA synthase
MTPITSLGRHTAEQPGLAYRRGIVGCELSTETVADVLCRVGHDSSDSRALACLTDRGLEALTWGEVYLRAKSVAASLVIQNPRRARVGFVAPNSVDWLIAMFGCALAGMPIVPLSPRSTDAEMHHIFSLTHVGVILVGDMPGDDVPSRVRDVAAQFGDPPLVLSISDWPVVDPTTSSWDGPKPTDEFLVQPTSGTTGSPKAASLSHRAVVNSARFFAENAGSQAQDIWFNPLPLHHVGGIVSGILAVLWSSATYVVVERFTSQIAMRAVREARATILARVPTMVIDLLDEPGVTEPDFADVRTVIGGATAVDPMLIDEIERRLGIRFLVAYGQSEAPCMTMSVDSDTAFVRTRTLGHPLPGRDYCIADRAAQVTGTSLVGELHVRGPLIMSGYLREDGTADSAVDGAGWMATGDLCSMDEDGVLTFHGRLREVIIRGGNNVYPAEVEQAMSEHELIAEIAVFGVPDERLGERVVAAVIPKSGAALDVEQLTVFAATRLGQQKRPAEWVLALDFPRTSTGKVRKHVLRDGYRDGRYRRLDLNAPGTHLIGETQRRS